MSTRYCVKNWQGLLQQVVMLCGKGYRYYHVVQLPVKKQDRWTLIDTKLIRKYQADLSKYQRARRKAKGLACFIYLRWDHMGILLHTEGVIPPGVRYDDRFTDVHQEPLTLTVSGRVSFDVGFWSLEKASVRLSGLAFARIRDELSEVARTKSKERMAAAYNRLNGLPAYSGIVIQKAQLRRHLLAESRRHGILWSKKRKRELRFTTRRRIVSVFVDNQAPS